MQVKKRYYLILLLVLIHVKHSFSQPLEENKETALISDTTTNKTIHNHKFILKFGTGLSSFWSNELNVFTYENELEYRFSNYFSTSLLADFGKNKAGTISFAQIAIDIFCSPFGNYKKNNIKFGFGVVRTFESEFKLYPVKIDNQVINYLYRKIDNNYIVGNVILQYSYSITDKFELGVEYCNNLDRFLDGYHTRLLINIGLKL